MPADFIISYSHVDEPEIQTYEKLLQRRGITVMRDRRLTRGELLDDEIRRAIGEALGAIPYLTPDFGRSDYIREKEIPWLLERAERDATFGIIPIFRTLRPSDIKDNEEYAHLRKLPEFLGNSLPDFDSQARAAALQALERVVSAKLTRASQRGYYIVRVDARGNGDIPDPDLALQWTDWFANSGAAPAATWEGDLVPALQDLRTAIDKARAPGQAQPGPQEIYIDGRVSVAGAFAIGQRFPQLSGYRLSCMDRDGQRRVLSAPGDGRDGLRVGQPVAGDGEDLVITLSIPQRIARAAQEALASQPARVRIDIEAETISDRFVRDDEQVSAIAERVTDVVRRSRAEFNTRGVRLFMNGPTTVAMALGTRLRSVGPIECPEYDNRTDTYVPTTIFAE
jgi:hypothetical protein